MRDYVEESERERGKERERITKNSDREKQKRDRARGGGRQSCIERDSRVVREAFRERVWERHEKRERERGNKSIQLQPVNKKGDTVKSEKERLKEQQYIIYQQRRTQRERWRQR